MKETISLIDGRNAKETRDLRRFFSEEALIFHRMLVEISWLRIISKKSYFPLREFSEEEKTTLDAIISNFSSEDANRVKEIEKTTNHDVKSVEIFLREKLEKTSMKDAVEWIHFACTSEDINNIAWALMIKGAINEVILPEINALKESLAALSLEWKGVPILGRTHGQPATPSTVGKEMMVFAYRLERQIKSLKNQEFLAKFAGATGNFAAHSLALPNVDWLKLSKGFVESFGLVNNPVVTQIEAHDYIAEISHNLIRVNTILIDFSRDIWTMVSLNFFTQRTIEGEVGSSTMPHKVNPIDFENAEGNFGMANALFKHFADKLPISRLQRDLSDSTVLRSIGTAFAHTLISLKKLEKGIFKLQINKKKLEKDLEENPEILAEAVQTVMRLHGIKNPYNKLKELTRGKHFSLEDFHKFVETLELPAEEIEKLKKLTPAMYTGISEKIVEEYALKMIKK